MYRVLAISMGALMTVAMWSNLAKAETITWFVQSDYPYEVQISFYSEAHPDYSWPGNGEAYVLDDSEVHEFGLECLAGDAICYGAWATGDGSIAWGAGSSLDNGCADCCYVCDGGSVEILLAE